MVHNSNSLGVELRQDFESHLLIRWSIMTQRCEVSSRGV